MQAGPWTSIAIQFPGDHGSCRLRTCSSLHEKNVLYSSKNEEAAVLQGYSPLQGSRFRLLGMNGYWRIPRTWIVSELVEINRENAQFSL
jgi:hypothetical protein